MDVVAPSTFESGNTTDNSADTISSFIADWVQIKYFYSEAASLAQDLCETLLASNAIRAIVTHRVKQGHRLEAKLRERVRKIGREYRNAKEIREDVVDLAGVRIALYFPSDREKIDKIIHDAFAVVKHKSFPEQDNKLISDSISVVTEKSSEFEQRFHGYSADHYRVRMRVENLATKKLRDDFQKTNPVIEIQVASVLMHAWAEIDHDLVYKTLTSGPASQQELRLLDATNGLVHTGEVLLQQLQTAMDDRVAYQNKPFSEQYELLSFLRGQIKKAKGSMEHLDILLLVLKMTSLDSPWKLGEMLKGFVIPANSDAPIALIILEHILHSLGEEQRRTNNLYLRPKSVNVDHLEVDTSNSKCYNTDVETRDRILDQRDILEMTVSVADIMRFPERSILVVEGMPQKFRRFYALYNLVHFATVRPVDKTNKDSEKWLCEISLRELDPLWVWFETNDDVLFRVSLLLARINVEEIDQELIKLRPSSGFQRLPSVYEPNGGYLSSGYRTPGKMSSGYSTPRSEDTESRFSKIPEEVQTPKSSPRIRSESSPSGSQNQESSPKSIEGAKSEQPQSKSGLRPTAALGIDNGDESWAEEYPSQMVLPERSRRPYAKQIQKPGSRKKVHQRNATPIHTNRDRKVRSANSEARPLPERRTENQAKYAEDGSSEGSNTELNWPAMEPHQEGLPQPYFPSTPVKQRTERHSARARETASMPGELKHRERERETASMPGEPKHRERGRETVSMSESKMPRVPEAPEPPYPVGQEDATHETEPPHNRRYEQLVRDETAYMPYIPVVIDGARPRRRVLGRSRRNDYYGDPRGPASDDPALRAGFEPEYRTRSTGNPRSHSDPYGRPPSPISAPAALYDYWRPLRH